MNVHFLFRFLTYLGAFFVVVLIMGLIVDPVFFMHPRKYWFVWVIGGMVVFLMAIIFAHKEAAIAKSKHKLKLR